MALLALNAARQVHSENPPKYYYHSSLESHESKEEEIDFPVTSTMACLPLLALNAARPSAAGINHS